MSRDYRNEIHGFTFGPLTFQVKGSGVFFMSDKLKERIASMTASDLKTVNRSAWDMRRKAARKIDAYSNVTRHGCTPYDDAYFQYDVADAVRKASWEALSRAESVS